MLQQGRARRNLLLFFGDGRSFVFKAYISEGSVKKKVAP
jgi:hypothetical protein